MNTLLKLGCAALFVMAAPFLSAQEAKASKADKSERKQAIIESRRAKVDAEENAKNIEKVSKELTWHTSLDAARKLAKKEGKLVFWIQALGDIDGYT